MASRADLALAFADLFAGNPNAYWTEGRMAVREPVDEGVWLRHLSAEEPIGIYPLRSLPEDDVPVVKWGCTDLDLPKLGMDPSDPTLPRNLHRVLKALGITSWVEKSRSKGWHVWVFCEAWCPAEWMRNALLVAHQVAGIPPTEVNPKQVGGVELGNLVRLPYAGHAHQQWVMPTTRQVVKDESWTSLGLSEFLKAAYPSRNSVAAIGTAAQHYKAPPPPMAVVERRPYEGGQKALTDRLSPLAWTVFNEGPSGRFGEPGQGLGVRYAALSRLAHLCNESGLSPHETLELLIDADARWGKFAGRKDRDQRLGEIVARAFG